MVARKSATKNDVNLFIMFVVYKFVVGLLSILCWRAAVPPYEETIIAMSSPNRVHITYGHKESADLRVAYSHTEAFALPLRSNKQQETYADMTICYLWR